MEWISCAVSMSLALASAPADAASLKDELERLLETHPRIAAERSLRDQAQASVEEARGNFLPTVAVNATAGPERVSSGTTRESGDVDTMPSNTAGIEVRQPLFTGFRNSAVLESQRTLATAADHKLRETTQRILLNGITDYLNVLRLSELIRVARARERTIRHQMRLEDERVQRGSGITVDVLQAKSRLQLAIEERVGLEGQLRTAIADYIESFQHEPDITTMRDVPPPVNMVPDDIGVALEIARDENPGIQRQIRTADSRSQFVDAERAGYYPRIDLVGSLNHEDDFGGVDEQERTASLQVELNWEIFSGFRTDARVKQALKDAAAARSASDATRRDVEKAVREAWDRLENTRERKELLLNAVSIANEVFSARQRLREAGKETALNVLDAENEVFQAEQNLIRADYDSRLAVYQLAAAMGILMPAELGLDSDESGAAVPTSVLLIDE